MCVDGEAGIAKLPENGFAGNPEILDHWHRTENDEFRSMFITGVPGISMCWGNKSAPAAIAFAVKLGAVQVDCYGMDWSGGADWDGWTPGNRDEDRWADERGAFEILQTDANRLGVLIRRVIG